jgi:hypothetical protein
MNAGVTEEVGKATHTFMDILRGQPLSLALVVMNFLLVAYMFYSGAQILEQRQDMAKAILDWTQKTDTLLASCVSLDVTKLMLDHMQKITETMLATEKTEITRMQRVIDDLRGRPGIGAPALPPPPTTPLPPFNMPP